MASELGLNESEYLRLKALNRERVVKSDEIAELYAGDQTLQTKKLLELETSFDKKLKAMLSPSQLATYAAYRQSPDTELALSEVGKTPAKKE
jgi:sulfate adenylyltransferase subunit 1 (EFTu-like GTPase family)